MARYALVTGGVVENVAEWDGTSSWELPVGTTRIQSDTATPGDTWDGVRFTKPPPRSVPIPVPPPILTTEQKLARIGLTVSELKAVLGLP